MISFSIFAINLLNWQRGDVSQRSGQTVMGASGLDHPGGDLVDFSEWRGRSKAKWDLTLDKAARLQAAVAYGCEGGEGTEHRFVG